MSQIVLTRLIWKEYRTQRWVWLVLLAIAWIFQFDFLLMRTNQHWEAGVPRANAMILCFCYLAAATATLFAGEREAGTRGMLQTLPVRPRDLLIGKLAFVIASSALLTMLLWVTTSSGSGIPASDWQPWIGLAVFCVTVSSFSLLASMTSRNVVTALISAAVALVTVALLVGWIDRLTQHIGALDQFVNWSLLAISALALLRSASLVPAWLRGEPVRAVSFPWKISLSRPTTLSPREASRLLQWSTTRSTPERRQVAALIWRESKAVPSVFLLWLVISVIAFGLTVWGSMEFQANAGYAFGLMWFFLVMVTPLIAGVATFSHDQRAGTMGFLSDRGASPLIVWAIKQGHWLTVSAVMLAVMWSAVPALHLFPRPGIVNLLPIPNDGRLRDSPAFAHTINSGRFSWDWGVSLFLSAFACGQLAAQWDKRTLTSLIGGVAACCALLWWHFALRYFGIPIWLGVLPLLLCAFAATMTNSSSWIKQQQHRWQFMARLGWVILPVLGTLLAIGVQRLASVPTFEPGFDWRAHEASMANFHQELTTNWDQFLETVKTTRFSRNPESTEELILQLEDLIQRSSVIPDLRLNPEWTSDDSWGMSLLASFGQLNSRAALLIQEGQLDDSWRLLAGELSAVQILERQAVISSDTLFSSIRHNILSRVREWAQHPQQTPEQLQTAASDLEKLPATYAAHFFKSHYVFIRQWLEHRGAGGKFWRDHNNDSRTVALFSWVERQRGIKVLNLATKGILQPLVKLEPLNRNDAMWFARVYPEIPRLWLTSPALTIWPQIGHTERELMSRMGAVGWPRWGTPQSTAAAFQLAIQRSRADRSITLLLVALERYRLENGAYPEQLSALLEPYVADLPVDPWTSESFHYEPHGLPVPVLVWRQDSTTHEVIPAGQPLLWTGGEQQVNIHLEDWPPVRIADGSQPPSPQLDEFYRERTRSMAIPPGRIGLASNVSLQSFWEPVGHSNSKLSKAETIRVLDLSNFRPDIQRWGDGSSLAPARLVE